MAAVSSRARRRRLLRDGTVLAVRPLMPSDRSWLAAAFAALSPQTRYRRFLMPLRTLSEHMLEELVDRVDQARHVALVAVANPGEPDEARIAVGRFVRDPVDESSAEVAFTVGDLWQGRGVGSYLLDCLLAEALARGVEHFTASVAPDNTASLRLLAHAGRVLSQELAAPGQLDVVVELGAGPPAVPPAGPPAVPAPGSGPHPAG